jgi:hypothetical protein
VRRGTSASLVAAAAFGAMALPMACNAIVGNEDIRFERDAEGSDATTTVEASVESGVTADAGNEGGDAQYDAPDTADAPPDASEAAPDAECEAGTKACTGICVTLDDPGYGCGPTHCSPCELSNAVAGCGALDGGADGGPLVCNVAVCKGAHADCNGTPLDGCETDTSDDLYNCGACGHDCSNLPHVAGNVSCAAGVCTFDDTACAPGYGICTTNPDNGCDTVISDPGHCGGCSTSCTAGFPYCSPSGSTASFTCTSGCAAGLSLCGASCVNEQTDPSHCGACGVQCPDVTGGTPTCSAGGNCGFTCNASYHACGTGSSAACAANNDPANCGVGAACGKCTAPANASPTCAGGTTCGYICNPGAHACGNSCVLNSDPNNCGSACGTNCPGPTEGAGVASCDGNVCAIACGTGESLCGSQCVNEQTDSMNCDGCGNVCGAGQTCTGGQCKCNPAGCASGCCDGTGTCQTASTSASCGTGGHACTASCPLTIPEAQNLVLWLVGDTYVSGATTWADQSGNASATCSSCPSTSVGALNGHNAVSFDGSSYFALRDPGGLYETAAFTIFVVAAPDPDAPTAIANAQLIAFSDGSGQDSLDLQQSGDDPDLLLQLVSGSSGENSLIGPGDWASPPFTIIAAGVDSTPSAFLAVDGSTVASGAIGTPASVDYVSSYLGTDPASQTLNYTGRVAEVLVFNTSLASTSISSVQTYLSTRYGLP